MELDDFAKSAVAAVLADQVERKTGFFSKVAGIGGFVTLVGVFLVDGWLRWLLLVLLLGALALLAFILVSRKLALSLINRLAPPADLGRVRHHFDDAVAEADIPTGPAGLLRLVWRLRKGVGPEIERLGAVVARFKSELG